VGNARQAAADSPSPPPALAADTSVVRAAQGCGQALSASGRPAAAAAAGSGLPIRQLTHSSIICHRFYTTDFDEMDEIFNLEKNPNLPMAELEAMLSEFRK
jgi:hypothetical protein